MKRNIAVICSIVIVLIGMLTMLLKKTIPQENNLELNGTIIDVSHPINIQFNSEEFKNNTVKSNFLLSTADASIKVVYLAGEFDTLHIELYDLINDECIQENDIDKLHKNLTFNHLTSDSYYYICITGTGRSNSQTEIGFR